MGPLAQAAICPQGLSSLAGEPTPNHQRQDAPPPLSAPSGPVSSKGSRTLGHSPTSSPARPHPCVYVCALCHSLPPRRS